MLLSLDFQIASNIFIGIALVGCSIALLVQFLRRSTGAEAKTEFMRGPIWILLAMLGLMTASADLLQSSSARIEAARRQERIDIAAKTLKDIQREMSAALSRPESANTEQLQRRLADLNKELEDLRASIRR